MLDSSPAGPLQRRTSLPHKVTRLKPYARVSTIMFWFFSGEQADKINVGHLVYSDIPPLGLREVSDADLRSMAVSATADWLQVVTQ